MEKATLDLAQLREFAAECADHLRGGEIIALSGELGAGQTTFAKAFLKAAGVRKRVTSPTFGLMVPYRAAGLHFYHIDLYRIGSFKELQSLGVTQDWGSKDSVYLIEWADKISKDLPKGTITISLSPTEDGRRSVRVSGKR